MAYREIPVLVCDLCGKDEDKVIVETHTLSIDGIEREAEACIECWVKVVKKLDPLYRAGREPKKRRPRALPKEAGTWPGSKWDFTFHALERMGERRVPVEDVLVALEKPEVTRPGRDEGVELRERGGIKVAVNLSDRMVLTASRVGARS